MIFAPILTPRCSVIIAVGGIDTAMVEVAAKAPATSTCSGTWTSSPSFP